MGVESKKYPFSVDTWTEMAMRKPFHFLTHAHKDHTVGIDSHGTHPIYCTSLTEKLVLRRYPTVRWPPDSNCTLETVLAISYFKIVNFC